MKSENFLKPWPSFGRTLGQLLILFRYASATIKVLPLMICLDISRFRIGVAAV